MRPKKILIIEDNASKAKDVSDFIELEFKGAKLTIRESYQSGLKEVNSNAYDLLLLDMSVPTYTKTPYETGGAYEKFGGYLILKELKRKGKMIPVILLTMFDDFGEGEDSISIDMLDKSLKEEFSPDFKGSVFYQKRETKWKENLKRLILELND